MNLKCDNCSTQLTKVKGQKWLYAESGVSDVVLNNITVYECPQCQDRTPVIPKIIWVHAQIGRELVFSGYHLTGGELRYLRKACGKSAKEWAKLLQVEPETVSRWENNEQVIGTQSELLVRYTFLIKHGQGGDFTENFASVRKGQRPVIEIHC